MYETFLYIVANLIKTQSYESLHEVFNTHYIIPPTERCRNRLFDSFDAFYGHSDTLQPELAPEGQRLFSPAAEFIKRHANRDDIPFKSIKEAELLVLLMAFLTQDSRWYPQTLYYASYAEDFPLFYQSNSA